MKAANLLFGTLESNYIWEYLGHHFRKLCEELNVGERTAKTMCNMVQPVGSGRPQIVELCLLTEFLLDFVSVVSDDRILYIRVSSFSSLLVLIRHCWKWPILSSYNGLQFGV